ncbi:hypothetical protein PTSG_04489 [Salpingoeca rosetta]|uniref:Uncharacterized protein n=1 Tax=Salpingoeca rosetta (strain ATCC 50818 / BSB-021) TaxID=946362 RepID=F2U8Q1_SALR5|nr:uncharacterized protein PTSG_04489 [Salpingoeca rosetta]EGD72759.1 hypothetical protein PTSG_04489 [Salpingoeca rosetta]|eukprot:XP_004994582.1 hypothetical protein PTSG_04489 [Salpingoeca rosetta]
MVDVTNPSKRSKTNDNQPPPVSCDMTPAIAAAPQPGDGRRRQLQPLRLNLERPPERTPSDESDDLPVALSLPSE